MSISVGRDCFARGEYVRTIAPRSIKECGWCGNNPARLYIYTWANDDAPHRAVPDLRRGFCNLGCFRSYHA